jgi:hypothetical protein
MSPRNLANSRGSNELHALSQLIAGWHELTAGELTRVSGGRPCRDDNDTNCYSLITLECRALSTANRSPTLSADGQFQWHTIGSA